MLEPISITITVLATLIVAFVFIDWVLFDYNISKTLYQHFLPKPDTVYVLVDEDGLVGVFDYPIPPNELPSNYYGEYVLDDYDLTEESGLLWEATITTSCGVSHLTMHTFKLNEV